LCCCIYGMVFWQTMPWYRLDAKIALSQAAQRG
jgi:hypothetical protein